jgi:hypothetical protein
VATTTGFELSERRDYVRAVVRGRPQRATMIELLAAVEELIAGREQSRVLLDKSDMDSELLTVPDIRAIADACSEALRRGTRIAVYATSPAVFGLSRMAQAFAADAGAINVFTDEQSALRWLLDSDAGDGPPPAA